MDKHFADYIHPSNTEIHIKNIVAGYTVTTFSLTANKYLTTFHTNWLSILKHLDKVYGEVDRLILAERAEKKNKEQV